MSKGYVMYAIGSEEVIQTDNQVYVKGPDYVFKVLFLSDGDFHITGKPRYKETISFVKQLNERMVK